MKIINNMKRLFLPSTDDSYVTCSSARKADESNAAKTDSLSYLVYEMRKQKGLLNQEHIGFAPILFGDEWPI